MSGTLAEEHPELALTPEPRPTRLSAAMRRHAAERMAKLLVEHDHLTKLETDGAVDDLVKYADMHKDGYQLAKALDDAGWDCDRRMAEELDEMPQLLRAEIDAAQKAWAERTNPEPTAAPGDRVRLKGAKEETGVIDEIYARGPAKFAVRIDGDPQAAPPSMSRRIVSFEDIEVLERAAEPADPAP